MKGCQRLGNQYVVGRDLERNPPSSILTLSPWRVFDPVKFLTSVCEAVPTCREGVSRALSPAVLGAVLPPFHCRVEKPLRTCAAKW